MSVGFRKRIDSLFAEWDKKNSPGCVVGVINNGKFIFKKGYGMAYLENSVPITPKTVFRVASLSKQFTAMCAALLIDSGKLSLNDSVRKFVPELPKYNYPVQVKHLIYHTSGLPDYLELMTLSGLSEADYYTADDVLKLLSRETKLIYRPGLRFQYCNTGYFLLSLIVQRVSGLSLREFAAENIFKPLGMSSTHFHDNHSMLVKNIAEGYMPDGSGGFTIEGTNVDIVGDGGLYTTLEDLYLWDQNYYNNKLGVHKKDLMKMFLSPGKLNNGESTGYAFGVWYMNYKGLLRMSHAGEFVGFRTQMIRFPKQKFSVFVLSNASSFNEFRAASRVADIFLGDKLKIKGYAGEYYSSVLDAVYNIIIRDSNLYLINKHLPEEFLEPVDADLFKTANKLLHFVRNKQGHVSNIILDNDVVKAVKFIKR